METKTLKYPDFAGASMADKTIDELPGIGSEYANRLKDVNKPKTYTMAYQILGIYLIHNKDEQKFHEFLEKECNALPQHAKICSDALKEWSDIFL